MPKLGDIPFSTSAGSLHGAAVGGGGAGASAGAGETTTYILPGLQFLGHIETGGRFIFATERGTCFFGVGVHELPYEPLSKDERDALREARSPLLEYIERLERYIKSRSTETERGAMFPPSARTRFDKLIVAVKALNFLRDLAKDKLPFEGENFLRFKLLLAAARRVEVGFPTKYPGGELGKALIAICCGLNPAYKAEHAHDLAIARVVAHRGGV